MYLPNVLRGDEALGWELAAEEAFGLLLAGDDATASRRRTPRWPRGWIASRAEAARDSGAEAHALGGAAVAIS